MLQKILSIFIPAVVLSILVSEIVFTPFYSQKELAIARESSIDMAQQGDINGSLKRFKALINIVPNDQKVWGDYITVLILAKRYEEAFQLADQHLDLKLAPAYIIDQLFYLAVERNEYRRAIKYVFSGLQISDDPEEYAINKSRILADIELFQDANDLLEQQLKTSPNNPRVEVEKIALALRATPHIDNRPKLHDMVKLHPDNEYIKIVLAQSITLQSKDETPKKEVLRELEQLYLESAKNNKIGGEHLVMLTWAEKYEQAAVVYDDIKANGLSSYVLEAAAVALLRANRIDDAEYIYHDLLERNNKSLADQKINDSSNKETIERGLANVHLKREDYQQAITILNPYASKINISTDTLESLALAYQGLSDWPSAAKLFARIMDLKNDPNQQPLLQWFDSTEKAIYQEGYAPYSSTLKKWLPSERSKSITARHITLLVAFNHHKLAQNIIDRGYTGPRLSKELGWQASVARDKKSYKKAINLYEFAYNNFPDNLDIKLGLALSYSESGYTQKADDLFNQLSSSNNINILDNAIYHYRRYGNDLAAKDTLKKLIDLSANKEPYLEYWIDIVQSDKFFNTPAKKLEVLHEVAPHYQNNQRWWQVNALFLASNNDCSAALSDLNHINSDTASEKSLESAAYVARKCRGFNQALKYYQSGVERYPNKAKWLSGLSLVTADLEGPDKALLLLSEYSNKYGNNVEFLMARAYAHEQLEQHQPALKDYETILVLQPDHINANRQYILLINKNGNNIKALQLASEKKSLINYKTWSRLYADEIAIAIRDASLWPMGSKERKDFLNIAAKKQKEHEDFLSENLDSAALKIARLDRIILFHVAGEYEKAIHEYQNLDLSEKDTPVYIHVKVADAHLQIGEINRGIKKLKSILNDHPDSQPVQSLLFYTYVENDQCPLAENLINNAILVELAKPQTKINKAPWSLQMQAMLDAYRDNLDHAEQKLQILADKYPTDQDITLKQALIDRWRGWPEKSLTKHKRILQEHPDLIESKVGEIYALLDLREYKIAKKKIKELDKFNSLDPYILATHQQWTLHNEYEFDGRLQYGRSSESAVANKDAILDIHLFDKPFADNYRFYGRYYNAWADLPSNEGEGELKRIGAGIDQRSRYIQWRAEINQSTSGDTNTGIDLSATYQPNDYWSAATKIQSYSLDVPLRAINDGIEGKSINTNIAYRWHEGRLAKINLNYLDLDDGNSRETLSASHTHTVFADQNHHIDITESIYAARNSEDTNRLYFNPKSEISTSIAVHYKGLILQSTSKRWNHHLTVGMGHYNQQDYNAKFIWDVDYEQRWRIGKKMSFYYGAVYKNRSYDGECEGYGSIYSGINLRFD